MSDLDFLYMGPEVVPYEFCIGSSTTWSDQEGKGLSSIAKAHFVKARENEEGKKRKKMDRKIRRENERRGRGKRRWKEKKSSSYNTF